MPSDLEPIHQLIQVEIMSMRDCTSLAKSAPTGKSHALWVERYAHARDSLMAYHRVLTAMGGDLTAKQVADIQACFANKP